MATSVVNPRVQFFANNGRPLIGGRIHTYVAGSSTRARTYKDAAKAQSNTNPIILDGRGEAQIYLAEGVEYKFVVEDSNGVLIYTQEPVYGAIWPNAEQWPSDATLSYQYMTEAKAAVDSMGVTRAPFDTYAQALAALSGLAEGDRIEVSIDETRDDARTRYKVEDGGLVFVVNLDQLRLDLRTAAGAQLVGLPSSTSAAQLQAAFDLRDVRKITLSPGQYDFDGQEFIIRGKNHSLGGGEFGEYELDFSGVSFSGVGKIIFDSCKRFRLRGLRAPGWDIEYTGVWWSVLENIQYRDHILGRAGTSFSNNYWNYGFNVLFQRVLIPDDAVGANNSFEWAGTMRGDNGQGFISTRAIAFEFLGNVNCQHWRFRGDISYHSQAVYVVGSGNTAGDVELEMDGYFDTVIPAAHNRAGVKIIANGHHANGAGLNLSHEAATRNAYRLDRSDRSLIHNPASGVNQVVNGDLSMTLPLSHPLMPVFTDASVSASFISGNSAASRAILQVTRADAGSVFFRTLQALTAGRYTGRWVARMPNGMGSRSIQFRVGSRYFTTTISDSQWHVVTLTEETPSTSGVAPTLTFNAVDNLPITINFAYIGLTYGAGGAMYERSVQPQTLIGELVTAIPTTASNATTLITVPCPGAATGDFVQWSCSAGVGAWQVSANIAASNEVRIYLRNTGAGDQSISSATWRVRVTKQGV